MEEEWREPDGMDLGKANGSGRERKEGLFGMEGPGLAQEVNADRKNIIHPATERQKAGQARRVSLTESAAGKETERFASIELFRRLGDGRMPG